MYKEKHILNHHTAGHKLSRYLDVYETTLQTDGNGTISASKLTGYAGDNVAGSDLTDALHVENIPVETLYWYNSTAMCAPNPIVQHSDIIADITWTE